MRLTEQHKRELLADANDSQRTQDLAKLKMHNPLSPTEYLKFLCEVSPVLGGDDHPTKLITGEDFRL